MQPTSTRRGRDRIMSELYQASPADELGPITYLIQGRLAPFFEPVEIGLGERLLMTAIASAYDHPKDEITKLNRHTGDLGLTAQRLAPAATAAAPSVLEVHRRLADNAAGSVSTSD